jgi:hypothetical protein
VRRYNFYYKQPVTPKELNDAFGAAEEALQSLATGMGLKGLALNGEVVERAPVSGLGATVLGPMIAYDDQGQRIFMPQPTADVDLTIDENSASTVLTAPNQERYLGIFAKFQRTFTDARRDGNDQDVFYVQDESYQLIVAAGAPAATGTASRPSLRVGHVLLADVRLTTGQTEVRTQHILTDRTQVMFRANGTNVTVQARTLQGVAQALVAALDNVVAGMGAETVPFAPTDDLDSTNVQAAIQEAVTVSRTYADTNKARLAGGNAFTGDQTVTGTVTAAEFAYATPVPFSRVIPFSALNLVKLNAGDTRWSVDPDKEAGGPTLAGGAGAVTSIELSPYLERGSVITSVELRVVRNLPGDPGTGIRAQLFSQQFDPRPLDSKWHYAVSPLATDDGTTDVHIVTVTPSAPVGGGNGITLRLTAADASIAGDVVYGIRINGTMPGPR